MCTFENDNAIFTFYIFLHIEFCPHLGKFLLGASMTRVSFSELIGHQIPSQKRLK